MEAHSALAFPAELIILMRQCPNSSRIILSASAWGWWVCSAFLACSSKHSHVASSTSFVTNVYGILQEKEHKIWDNTSPSRREGDQDVIFPFCTQIRAPSEVRYLHTKIICTRFPAHKLIFTKEELLASMCTHKKRQRMIKLKSISLYNIVLQLQLCITDVCKDGCTAAVRRLCLCDFKTWTSIHTCEFLCKVIRKQRSSRFVLVELRS